MPFVELKDAPVKEPVPGYKAVFIHSENMTLAYWEVEEGAVMPIHSHPHEQVASVVEGQFELTLAGETRMLNPGIAAIIPSNTPHGGRALTACRLIDAFHPIREDYR